MNAKIAAGIVLAGLLIAGVTVYLSEPNDTAETPVGAPQPAPPAAAPVAPESIDFSLADLEGKRRSVSEWNGNVRLINFWATWCAPCRREIPLLKQTQAEHGGNNVQVIGVAVEEVEPVLDYAAETEFNYPILVGEEDAMAAAEESGIPFIGLPFTVVLAPGGELLGTRMGEIHAVHIEEILEVSARLVAGEIDLAGARESLADL